MIANRKNVFRHFISKFFPVKEKLETGETVILHKFNKQQLVGAIIRTGKHTAFRIINGAQLGGDKRMLTGDHELIQLKIR